MHLQPVSEPTPRPAARFGPWLVLVLALGAAAWSAGVDGPYLFDDFATPLDDPASASLGAWGGHLGVTLRPVTKLTYALEAEAGLVRAPHRRATSILLHAVAGAMLGLLLLRLEPRLTGAGAALGAAIWLLHPVHAESVLAASGRSALLAGLLLLAALLAFEARRAGLAAALFLLACLARETALAGVLPLAVLAAARPGDSAHARLTALVPVLVAGAAALAWCATTPRYLRLAEYSFLGRPFAQSVYAQVGAVPVGLGLLVEPSRLSIDYGLALPGSAADPLFLLGLLLYLLAAAGALLAIRRSLALAVGLALWLAALLPTQSLVPKLDALTNRPLSLALAGLLLALSPALARCAGAARSALAPQLRPAVAACAALLLLAPLGVAAAGRASLYRSPLALWGDAAAHSTRNARPHVRHALLLEREGRHAEARAALAAARAIDPFNSAIAALSRAPQGAP